MADPDTDYLDAECWMKLSGGVLTRICAGYKIDVKKHANQDEKINRLLDFLKENPGELIKLQGGDEEEDDDEDEPPLPLLALVMGQVKVSRVTAEILDLLEYNGAMRPVQGKTGKNEKRINRALAPAKELVETIVEARKSITTLRPSPGTMFHRLGKIVLQSYAGKDSDALVVHKELKPWFKSFGIKVKSEAEIDTGESIGISQSQSQWQWQSSTIPYPSQKSALSSSADRPGRLAEKLATIKLALEAYFGRWLATFPDSGKPVVYPGSFDHQERRTMCDFINAETTKFFGDDFDYAEVDMAKRTALVDQLVSDGKVPHLKERSVILGVVNDVL